jgi:hypothetical protein
MHALPERQPLNEHAMNLTLMMLSKVLHFGTQTHITRPDEYGTVAVKIQSIDQTVTLDERE